MASNLIHQATDYKCGKMPQNPTMGLAEIWPQFLLDSASGLDFTDCALKLELQLLPDKGRSSPQLWSWYAVQFRRKTKTKKKQRKSIEPPVIT